MEQKGSAGFLIIVIKFLNRLHTLQAKPREKNKNGYQKKEAR